MHSRLSDLPLRNARVLLRADLNFDPDDSSIHHRLHALLPTLTFLRAKGARTLLVTHRGRAQDKLSTEGLLPLLASSGHPATFAPTIAHARTLLADHDLILLQNIRFWPGECAAASDPMRSQLAHELREATQLYVTEAFGALHRHDCSIVDLPALYAPHARTIGPLIETELRELAPLRDEPKRPYIVIVGGAKIDTKLPLLPDLLSRADTLIVLPALSFALDQARGLSVGASLFDANMTTVAHAIVTSPTYTRVITPSDYVVAKGLFSGPRQCVPAGQLATDQVGVTFGPETLARCIDTVAHARTVFFTGISGNIHVPQTTTAAQKLLECLPGAHRKSIIAGGDTVAAAQRWNTAKRFSFISTGGGASLTYIAGQQLPGLEPFKS